MFVVVLRFLIFILILFFLLYNAPKSNSEIKKSFEFPSDYRGIVHLHSELSHDSNGKLINIYKAAKNNNIDFVILTDHWSPELFKKSYSGFLENILFITGSEISKNEGVTLLAIPLPEDFVPVNDWRKNIDLLHQKGSLALASHIEFSKTSQLANIDGIEIINLHAHILEQNKFGLTLTYFKALLPWNWDLAYIFNDIPELKRWQYLNQNGIIPAFGGNDTHDNYRLFYKIGPKLGSYDNTFKLITTHVWANKLTQQSIVEAIKNGQTYFSFEIFGNSNNFRFYALNGENMVLPGKKTLITKSDKIILVVQTPPHKNPENTKIKILRNGKILKENNGILLKLGVDRPGNYYVEIWKNEKPWIFSNPIQIRSE